MKINDHASVSNAALRGAGGATPVGSGPGTSSSAGESAKTPDGFSPSDFGSRVIGGLNSGNEAAGGSDRIARIAQVVASGGFRFDADRVASGIVSEAITTTAG